MLLLLLLLLCVAEDVYVHAELHGASSTIIRNHDPSRPVPPLTLQQAGCACVCRSKAWDAKLVTSAWWVQHHQVRTDVLLGGGGEVGVIQHTMRGDTYKQTVVCTIIWCVCITTHCTWHVLARENG